MISHINVWRCNLNLCLCSTKWCLVQVIFYLNFGHNHVESVLALARLSLIIETVLFLIDIGLIHGLVCDMRKRHNERRTFFIHCSVM